MNQENPEHSPGEQSCPEQPGAGPDMQPLADGPSAQDRLPTVGLGALIVIAFPRLLVDLPNLAALLGRPAAERQFSRPWDMLFNQAVIWMLILGVAWCVGTVLCRRPWRRVFGVSASRRMALPFVIGLAGTMLLTLVAIITQPEEDQSSPIVQMMNNPDVRPVIILQALVFAPFLEELFFRGAFYWVVDKVAGAAWAVAASALWFGLIHMAQHVGDRVNLVPLAYITGVGLIWTLLRWRTGSAVPGIICHFAYNFVLVLAG